MITKGYLDMAKEKRRIKRNAIQCLKCEDVIESKFAHDFKTCSCGNVSVDGGKDYLRRVTSSALYKDLSEYE